MIEKRETVGQISAKLHQQDHGKYNVRDVTEQVTKTFNEDLKGAAIDGIKKGFIGDFFIVGLQKTEKLAKVIRTFFFARKSPPSPNYDQIVYKYHRSAGMFELVWTIPSRPTCIFMMKNLGNLHSSLSNLVMDVMRFSNGTLHKWCRQLNGEIPDDRSRPRGIFTH
jgi:hypothetical protein